MVIMVNSIKGLTGSSLDLYQLAIKILSALIEMKTGKKCNFDRPTRRSGKSDRLGTSTPKAPVSPLDRLDISPPSSKNRTISIAAKPSERHGKASCARGPVKSLTSIINGAASRLFRRERFYGFENSSKLHRARRNHRFFRRRLCADAEPERGDPRGPVATDPADNGAPSANPTDRGGGAGGPAIKRSQERGKSPAQRPRRQMDE